MALNDGVHGSVTAQYFPQPSRPNNSYQNSFESSIPDNRVPFLEQQEEEEEEEKSCEKGEHDIIRILKGVFEEVEKRGFESLKKGFSKVGKKFPFERFIIKDSLQDNRSDNTNSGLVENLRGKQNQGAWIDPTTNTDKGVDLDMRSMGEESNPKMERFKVKTVKLGGVAKQEHK